MAVGDHKGQIPALPAVPSRRSRAACRPDRRNPGRACRWRRHRGVIRLLVLGVDKFSPTAPSSVIPRAARTFPLLSWSTNWRASRLSTISGLSCAMMTSRAAKQKHRSRHHPQPLVTALKFGLLMFQPCEPFTQLACRLHDYLHKPNVVIRQGCPADSSARSTQGTIPE